MSRVGWGIGIATLSGAALAGAAYAFTHRSSGSAAPKGDLLVGTTPQQAIEAAFRQHDANNDGWVSVSGPRNEALRLQSGIGISKDVFEAVATLDLSDSRPGEVSNDSPRERPLAAPVEAVVEQVVAQAHLANQPLTRADVENLFDAGILYETGST